MGSCSAVSSVAWRLVSWPVSQVVAPSRLSALGGRVCCGTADIRVYRCGGEGGAAKRPGSGWQVVHERSPGSFPAPCGGGNQWWQALCPVCPRRYIAHSTCPTGVSGPSRHDVTHSPKPPPPGV